MKIPEVLARSEFGRSIWTFRREFAWVGVFSLFANLLMLSPTLYMLQVFDRVMLSQNEFTLIGLTAVITLFFAMMLPFGWVTPTWFDFGLMAANGVSNAVGQYWWTRALHLAPASAVALTLRAVGGLTTRQIADAYLVPERTMAQRISRAKRTVGRDGIDRPGDVRTVMRVLYLVFNEGYSGDVDLAAEAIRLTRQLAESVDDPEVHGLLALMLLHHARRASRTAPDGRIVPLAEQDRRRWDHDMIAEGVTIVQAALTRDRLGEYQAQAAIAALPEEFRVPLVLCDVADRSYEDIAATLKLGAREPVQGRRHRAVRNRPPTVVDRARRRCRGAW